MKKEEEERAKMTEKFIKAEMRAEKKKRKREPGEKLAVKREVNVKRLIEEYENKKMSEKRNEKRLARKCTEVTFKLFKEEAR